MRVSTPWIYTPKFDLAAILGPPALVTGVVLIFGHKIAAVKDTPPWLWVLLVLFIDVAHVYSSLYRTYFDKEEFAKRRTLYILAPLLSWLIGVAIYGCLGPVAFWSVVAYFAIYHFVRQQYGFLMLYRRGEPVGNLDYRIDQLAIYLATLYPLVYWHTYPRNFQWFSGFEVLRIPYHWPEQVLRGLYVLVLGAFLAKETAKWAKTGKLNVGKVGLLLGTAASWGTGIILFNGDLTFTLINIVSHGVPYMALVWIYQHRKRAARRTQYPKFLSFFQVKYLPIYVFSLFALAFFEEGVWDWFVWREHPQLFGGFHVQLQATALVFLIPLLTMPQVTHYVLDAFIWRVNKMGHEEVRAVIG
ncbi:MAG: hypothetical protein JNM34_05190 [Chthonomonadaceae bacterium]|nr:hypothetical protein [Chthonomonadaceae bacterium]